MQKNVSISVLRNIVLSNSPRKPYHMSAKRFFFLFICSGFFFAIFGIIIFLLFHIQQVTGNTAPDCVGVNLAVHSDVHCSCEEFAFV